MDAIGIPFAHSKDERSGSERRKRMPRHVFGNPFDYQSDYNSALFDYIATSFPEGVGGGASCFMFQTRLAVYSQDWMTMILLNFQSNSLSFWKSTKKILQHSDTLLMILGYTLGEKVRMHTYMNNGLTAGPSSIATCIRGGHTIGGSRDIYVLHARAGDTYCGRVLSGLPLHRAEFAASYPDFTAVKEVISVDQLANEQESSLDVKINKALCDIFGQKTLELFPKVVPVFRVGLASHLHR